MESLRAVVGLLRRTVIRSGQAPVIGHCAAYRHLQQQADAGSGLQLSRAASELRSLRHVLPHHPLPAQHASVIRISGGQPVQVITSGSQTIVIRDAAGHHVSPYLLGFLLGGGVAGLLGCAAYGMSHHSQHLIQLSKEELRWPKLPWWPFSLGTAKACSNVQPTGMLPTPWLDPQASQPQQPQPLLAGGAAAAGDSLMRSSISEAAARAAPAVVHLVVGHPQAGGGSIISGGPGSSGSGFIYSSSDGAGWVLTNAHVVVGAAGPDPRSTGTSLASSPSSSRSITDGASSSSGGGSSSGSSSSASRRRQRGSGPTLLVHLQDGRVFEGSVVALDRLSDLAVVRIPLDTGEQLPTARLGSSARLRVGEWVLALGSPLLLKQSVTAGIVSCVERKGSELGIHTARTEYIQTDAAINSGNSGGPLVNLDGEVVGLCNIAVVGAQGLSFAQPIDSVKEVVHELGRYGRVLRPYVGLTLMDVPGSRMRQLQAACPDFPRSVQSAVVVTRVAANSPAAAAGIKEDDVIVGCEGGAEQALGMRALADLFKLHIGQPLSLKILRQQRNSHPQSGHDWQPPPQQDAAGGRGFSYTMLPVSVNPIEAPPT